MTTLAPVPAGAVRSVPWPRLGWVAWRRYRATLVATIGLLLVVGSYVLLDGLQMRTAYDAYLACTPPMATNCEFAWMSFREFGVSGFLVIALTVLPGIVGAFAGAPVLARELETGTFRYTFTQGAGRMRWAIAQLVPGMLGVAVIMGAFGMLVAWHDQPLADTGITPRMRATAFAIAGPAIAGWALAAFALGVLAGMLWRRVLPALATAFAVWFGLAFLTATVLRPNYENSLTTTSLDLPVRDLSLDQWWTKGGVRVGDADISQVLQSVGIQAAGGTTPVPAGAGGVDPDQYLLQHGYQQVTSYQPDGRFWTFQWIEFGWLTTLALLLLGIALWLLRRRAA